MNRTIELIVERKKRESMISDSTSKIKSEAADIQNIGNQNR